MLDEAELMQRAGKITGKTAVDLLHVIMYGAQIRTVQNGEPCWYLPPEDAEGWTWPLIDERPVEPVRRLTQKDYNKAKMRARRRGISERQLHSYDARIRREKATIARAIDELDNLLPPPLELT